MTILAILLLFLPILFQYKIGNRALSKTVRINFLFVCLISLALQIILTYLGFEMALASFAEEEVKCMTGVAGILGISFMVTLFMIFLMIGQVVNKK